MTRENELSVKVCDSIECMFWLIDSLDYFKYLDQLRTVAVFVGMTSEKFLEITGWTLEDEDEVPAHQAVYLDEYLNEKQD